MKLGRLLSILVITIVIIGCSKEDSTPKPQYKLSLCNHKYALFDSIIFEGAINECLNSDPVYIQIASTAKTTLINDSVAKIEVSSSDLTKDTTLLLSYKCFDKHSISLKYFDNNSDTLGFQSREVLFVQYKSDFCDYNHYFQGYKY